MGLMGAGKTSLGSALAALWGLPLYDSDAELLAETGRTAKELLLDLGVDGLHDLEARHLLRRLGLGREGAPVDSPGALDPAEPGVIAAAASTIDRPDCRAALGERALVVWVDVALETLVARQASGGHRPRYSDDLLAMLRRMDALRRPHFAACADVVVRTGPGDGVLAVAERVRQSWRRPSGLPGSLRNG
jgi:shikimate kinase